MLQENHLILAQQLLTSVIRMAGGSYVSTLKSSEFDVW